MSLQGIYFYCARAVRFAAVVSLAWALWTVARGRVKGRAFWLRLTLTFYLATLLEITVLRGGRTLGCFWQLPHTMNTVIPRLLSTTRAQWRAGWWYFCYHAIGNLCWFVPLGFLAPRRWRGLRHPLAMLAVGAGLSLLIESMQWVLVTGTSDVDDLLWNTLGAVVGWLLWRLGQACRQLAQRKKSRDA